MKCKHLNCELLVENYTYGRSSCIDGVREFIEMTDNEPTGIIQVECFDCGLNRRYKDYPKWLKERMGYK